MLQTGLDFMEATVELTGVAKSKLSKLYSRNINSVQGYADLCKTATKIKHKAMEKRKCLSGKIKFALFPRSLWLWSLRRNSGIDVLIKEFKQGLKDIHGKLASEADETSTSLKKEIEEYFECIGESIESSGQPETGEERSAESLETIDDTIQNSEHHILAFLHGKNVFGGEMSDTGEILISLDSVMESFLGKLNISKIDGIKNLTEKHLQDCIDENKSIMIIEGGDVERNCNVLLIRKNEKGTLEVTRFTEQPKTLKSNGGIQMDSGDYVNAFQLFDLKNSESFETKKTNLQRICSGSVQAKEVPKEKMFLTKSRGKNTSPEFELLQALQYAAKGNPSQEALVAEFEIGRYVAHLSNFKSKMETPEQNLLFDRNTVTFNTLSRDVQQRILSLQASGKISTEAASKYLSQINRMIVSPAERTSNPAAVDPSLTSEAGAQSLRSHTTYTQDSTLQTSNGYNVGVYKDIPTFLKQTMCDNDDYMSVRLTMGFASAQRFEELISNHKDTLETLKGKNANETLKNIVGFFRMAVVYTEYNKRNGIAVPKDKQEIYDNLIKLGAAIYEKYGKECEINETTYQCQQARIPGASVYLHKSEKIKDALFNTDKPIESYQDIEPLLSSFDKQIRADVRADFIATPTIGLQEDGGDFLMLIHKLASNGFAYMLLSLDENSKDGIAFPRQDSLSEKVIKNVSFGEQLQSDFQEICGFLSDNAQGKIAQSKYAKRFPFLEHCHLPTNGNFVQKAEAMFSWLQTSGNVNIFDNLEMQRMFCKLLCGDANNPQALVGALKDRATREQFVHIVNQFFKTAIEDLPSPVKTEADMQKYKFYASLHIQLNETIKKAGGPELEKGVFDKQISPDSTVNEGLNFACVLCKKMINVEKLTADEILKCTDQKMMIWPEMAGANDTLLERDPEDSSGIKNMFEKATLEVLRNFIIDQVNKLEENDFQEIGREYSKQPRYEDHQVTVDVDSKLITIKDRDNKTKVCIDLNNFVCLIDGKYPEEYVKEKKEEHLILAKLGIDGTNIHSRVKVDDNISTVDGKIIIDNRTNKVTMDDKVLVTPKPLPPNENSTVIDLILSRFLPFAEETDTVCKKIYFYDPMSLNESVFVLEDGKLHTSNSEYEYKFPLIKVCRGSPDAFCNPLLQSLSCNGETKTNVFETTDDSGNVLSLMMPDVHYNNQVLQFNRGEDNELHLASNEQYVLSKHPEPNPLGFSGLNYICLRSKENPSDYKFILINNKNLIDSSSIDNRVRQEIPILRQDVLEIGFNPITGFELSSSNYQATGIILARNLFNLSKNECALDILNKINMREVVAGRNSALLSLVFRPLITDTSKGSVLKIKSNQTLEQNLVTFKIITLLFELDPYNFRNLLLAKDENGTINTGDSFELIMQISSLYQSFVDAKENSMIEVNISKENESTIMEEIMRAMWLAMPPNILTLLRCIPEGVVLNRFLEYGLLKLFEQNHQASTQEFGTQTDVKYLTKVKTDAIDHEIIHYQPGGTRSFKKASEFSSVFPTRKTEMVAKLRREARETALLQLSSSIERRKIFLVKCCRKDNDIYADTDLSEQQKRDYIAFRKAMDFPQFTDDVIINSVQEVFISEIEGFLSNQSTDRKHSKALNIESVVRKSILDEILQPVKAPQIDAQHSIKGTDLCTKYKIDILLDVVQWDERVIQSNEALTKNDKQLILAFKKKHANTINNPEFKAGHESELLDLANAISGQNRAFSSSNRKEITQYNSTAEEELGRYNEEMSLAGSQDLRARALGELYEIKAESFLKTEGEEKSLIESTIDSIANQIETAKIEETENSERLKEIFSNCSRTMASLRQTKLAKTPNLNDAIKALVCAPSDPEGDWSKSVKILQDINPEFTIIDCKEIVDLARQQLQASTAIKSMEQLKTAVENVRDKGKALLDANQEFPTHGATDLTPEQKDFTSAKDQLIAAYESVRTYNPKTEMEELAFEGTVGFRVRGAQANIVKNVTAELQANEANNEQTGVTFQLMMGGGKTSVILSQLAHIISQQHRIPLFVCHPSQYTSMSGNLRLFQESRYSQEVISIGESKSDLQDSSKLLGILRKLKRAKDGGGCLVIQAPTLRAIKLEFIRTSRLAIESKDPAVMVRAKQLANILSEIKENCVQLLDEIDLNLDISKSVNFPSGARKPLARSQIDVIASMLDLVTQEPELYKAFCGDKFRVEKDGKIPIDVFKQKVVDGCFDQIQKLDSSIKKEDFQKFMLGTGKPNEDFEKAWKMIKKKYPEQAEKIALQNGMLSIVDSAAKNEYNRHYGFREDGAVIPYQGVGTPSSGEFGNVYEQAYYFFAAVLHNGIQLSQMTSLVEKYIDGSISESSKEQLESLWNSSDLGKLSDLKRMSDAQRNAAIQKTTEQLNQNKTSPYFMSFAKILAANAVNYSPQSLEGDAISMIDITKTSIGCTGTPWNRQTYHSAFQGDNKAILEPGTEGKIIQKWQKDFRTRTSKILTPEAATVSSVLEAHKKAHVENSENLRALVDAGGIFKDKTNEEVARDILKYYRDDTNVQSVVYLGKTMTGEESFFVMQRSDPSHPVPIPNTSPQEIEKVVGRGNIGKTFTYFDELRCTGCDIPLDKNARAILTTNPDTTPIRTVLQGILRARKFLDSQTVDLCVLQDSMPSDVNVNTDEPEKIMAKICSRCIENQSAMLAKQTYKSYRAQISNCLKSILFERLHESISKHDGGKISKKEQRILDLCNKFIYSSFEANPLELFGGFTSEQKAYDALRNYYESILANIEKEDKSIAKEFQDRAEKILNQSEKVLNFSVQEGVFDAGTEVEAETETEMEQEREQERVTEDSSKVTEETSWDILNVRVSTGNDVPTTAEASVEVNLEESGQVTDNAPQAPKSLEERTKMMIDDFQSVDFTEGSTLKSILESQEDNGNTTDLVDQRLQAVAKKNGVSDRELLLVLNESYNNEEGRTKEAQLDFSKRTLLSKYVSSLIDKTKTRILGEAPTFASLIAIEGTSFPRILSVNECVASKTDQLIFKENVQITANLANNAEGVKWMDDSQRKDAQFVLVYKTDDETFKTLLLSDQDAQEIGKAMVDLNVKDCWMFNAAGNPMSTNPLATIEEDVLDAGRKSATDLAILYGNFHHLNSTEDKKETLRSHAHSNEVQKNFLKRVQILRPREYDDAVKFFQESVIAV